MVGANCNKKEKCSSEHWGFAKTHERAQGNVSGFQLRNLWEGGGEEKEKGRYAGKNDKAPSNEKRCDVRFSKWTVRINRGGKRDVRRKETLQAGNCPMVSGGGPILGLVWLL